jgi:hypothetical protein
MVGEMPWRERFVFAEFLEIYINEAAFEGGFMHNRLVVA